MAEKSTGTAQTSVNAEDSDQAISVQPKRRRCSLLCGHCDRYLSKSTYYRHRAAYFNHASGHWQRLQSDDVSSLSDDPSSGAEQGNYLYNEGLGEGQ